MRNCFTHGCNRTFYSFVFSCLFLLAGHAATAGIAISGYTNPTTCSASDGSISFTSTGIAAGTQTLKYTRNDREITTSVTVASDGTFTLSGLDVANYTTLYIVYSNGYHFAPSNVTLTTPSTPTFGFGTVTHITNCGTTTGSAVLTGLMPSTTYSVSYRNGGASIPTVISATGDASGNYTLANLRNGTAFVMVSVNGCTSTMRTVNVNEPGGSIGNLIGKTLPSTCNGTNGSFAMYCSLPGGNYTLNYSKDGVPTSSPITVISGINYSPSQTALFELRNLGKGTYTDFSIPFPNTTNCFARPASWATSNSAVILADVPNTTSVSVVSPSGCTGLTGSISLSGYAAGTTYTVNYTKDGTPMPPVNLTANTAGKLLLNSMAVGSYTNIYVTRNGCSNTPVSAQVIANVGAAVGSASGVGPSDCGASDGKLVISGLQPGQSYSVSYQKNGNFANASVTGDADGIAYIQNLTAGLYQNIIVAATTGGCSSGMPSVELVAANAPAVSAATTVNPTNCSGNGKITLTVPVAATYQVFLVKDNVPQPTQNLTANAANNIVIDNVAAGRYYINLGANGCRSLGSEVVLLPAPSPTLVGGEPTYPSACGQAGSIPFTTTNLNDGNYLLTYQVAGTTQNSVSVSVQNNAFTLANTPNNVYLSSFRLTNAAQTCLARLGMVFCMFDSPIPIFRMGTSTNPTAGNANGRINFTTTTVPNGTYTVNYNGPGSSQTVFVSAGAFSLTGLSAGTYRDFSITINGCIGTEPAVKTLTNPATRLGSKDEDKPMAEVAPNPVADMITVTLYGLKDQSVRLRLANVWGQQQHAQTLTPTSDAQTVSMNVNKMANGVYFLETTANNNRQTIKVLKVN